MCSYLFIFNRQTSSLEVVGMFNLVDYYGVKIIIARTIKYACKYIVDQRQ